MHQGHASASCIGKYSNGGYFLLAQVMDRPSDDTITCFVLQAERLGGGIKLTRVAP